MFIKTASELGYPGYPLALTLKTDYLGENESGWIVTGDIHEDYHKWINEFEAFHPTYGKVWGDFQEEVYADSEEAFNHFYKNHPPQEWDYGDI